MKFFVSQKVVQVLLWLFVLLRLPVLTKFRLVTVLFVSLDCAIRVYNLSQLGHPLELNQVLQIGAEFGVRGLLRLRYAGARRT